MTPAEPTWLRPIVAAEAAVAFLVALTQGLTAAGRTLATCTLLLVVAIAVHLVTWAQAYQAGWRDRGRRDRGQRRPVAGQFQVLQGDNRLWIDPSTGRARGTARTVTFEGRPVGGPERE